MAVRTQLSVFLQNEPGQAAKLARCLARAKVNIEAVSAFETGDTGVVRLLVDATQKARETLKREKFPAIANRVITVRAKNEPGVLAGLAGRLAKGGINILYAYGSAGTGSEGILVLGVSDVRKASRLLK